MTTDKFEDVSDKIYKNERSEISSELKIQNFWQENNIFDKVKLKNKGNKAFNWVEGPPYPTGEAHLGHMRNWSIKDSVLRFKRLQGFDVYTKDGYDVHGLPVEQKVQKKLGISDTKELKDKFGVDNFIVECRKYVDEIINDMKGLRSRYGFWLDTNHWQTSHPEYTSMAWQFFKKAQEKNLLYKDFKCVAWSPGLETTLSDYEVKDSYAELEDPSIYVRFKVKKENTTTKYDEYLLIWTTTPWTLEANLAIAVNKGFNYVKVLVEDEVESYVIIVGDGLVDQVISKLSKSQNIKSHKVIETIPGVDLVGIHYEHIYPENPTQIEFAKDNHYHKVLHADFVSLGEGETHLEKLEKKSFKHDGPAKVEDNVKQKKVVKDGTGLAHEAPAHGMEDFDLCRAEGLKKSYCVVDERGNMISESLWAGKNFRDSNKEIIDYLMEKRIILHSEWRVHTYPLCWRSKVPIVYRTTEQWYIKRGDYTSDVIKANSNVHWFPHFAQTKFDNLMEGAGDWAISRQRFWGTPIPIFEDEDGNYEVMGSKEELESKVGKKLEDLHLDNLAPLSYNGESGKVMKHVGYTCDVWFDSGCASFASHYGEGLSFDQIIKKYYPMSWVTEGEDQIRGWFSSLFNVGYMVTDRAPYNQVLFQGFVMAKDGTKMSKSLGNGITGNESLEKYGSDATRYYLLTKSAPEAKLNFDMEEFEIVFGFFNTLENVFKYCNGYLAEYEVKHPSLNLTGLDAIDKWILYKLNRCQETFTLNMEQYKMNVAFKEVENFIVNDFSKVYLKLIKDRTDERDENLVVIMNEVLRRTLVMLGSAIPFKAEKIYLESNLFKKKESLFLENLCDVDSVLIKKVEEQEIHKNFDLAQDVIGAILNSREKAKIGVRWPLSQIDIISTIDLKNKLKVFEPLIKKLTNIVKIKYDLDDVKVNFLVKPNFATIKNDFKDVSNVIKVVNMNKHYISSDLKKELSSGTYDGINLDYDKHLIKELELDSEYVSSDFGSGNVILHTHQDEILLEEGFIREITRKIQSSRKDMGLDKKDSINLSFEGSDGYILDLILNCENLIKKKVGAIDILQNKLGTVFELEIKDKMIVISIDKV